MQLLQTLLANHCNCYYIAAMDLRTWLDGERGRNARLAARTQIAPGYLSQMADGKRPVPHSVWQEIADETAQQVMPWDLWPEEWFLIWPDLIGTKGAPKVKLAKAA